MSTAEELLDNLTEEQISMYTADARSERHIIIDSNRKISVPSELKRIAVQYDNNIETVTFDCPRYWDDNDMSQMNIYVNYIRADKGKGSFHAINVSVDEIDPSMMHFDWVIDSNVTEAEGFLSFLVCIKKSVSGGDEEIHWNTEINSEMYISGGLECASLVTSQYPDVINSLFVRMDDVEKKSENIKIQKTKSLPIAKANIDYQSGFMRGATEEESAQILATYDILVPGGSPLFDFTLAGSENSIRDLRIIRRAKEINPDMKLFWYISIASSRSDNIQTINRHEILTHYHNALHVGAYRHDDILDDEGFPTYSGDYISFDGVFWDDVDMDNISDNTAMIAQGGWASQRAKQNDLANEAHKLGLSVISNDWQMLRTVNPEATDNYVNPEGIPTALGENDYFLLESYTIRGDGLWCAYNDGTHRCYNYRTQYYDTGICKAKIIALSYGTAPDGYVEKLRTWCLFEALCCGAHYLATLGQGNWDVPEEFQSFTPPDGGIATYTKLGEAYHKMVVNNHTIIIRRNTTLTGRYAEITEKSIDSCVILIDGVRMENIFQKAGSLSHTIGEDLAAIQSTMDTIKSSSKGMANMYTRLLIDDWEKAYSPSEFTNLIDTMGITWSHGNHDSYTEEEGSITVHYSGVWCFVQKQINISDTENADLRGKTLEFGCTNFEYNDTSNPPKMGVTMLNNGSWSDVLLSHTFNDKNLSSTQLYNPNGIYYTFSIPEDFTGALFLYPMTQLKTGSVVEGAYFTISNVYLVDTAEFEDIIEKTWYTNLIGGGTSSGSGITVSKDEDDGYTYEFTPASWNDSFLKFGVDISLKAGHTYEFGLEEFRVISGPDSDLQILTSNASGTGLAINSSASDLVLTESEVGRKKMMINRFTVSDDASLSNVYVGFYSKGKTGGWTDSDGNTQPLIGYIKGLYLYDLSERDELVIRGVDPAKTWMTICRVKEENLVADQKIGLVRNAMYVTNTGKLFFTDYLGDVISASGETAHHYSTEEQIVGTWIDGKPLYEITYTFEATIIQGNTWTSVPIVMPENIDKCIRCEGYQDGGNVVPIGFNPAGQVIHFRNAQMVLEGLTVVYTKN